MEPSINNILGAICFPKSGYVIPNELVNRITSEIKDKVLIKENFKIDTIYMNQYSN